MICFDASRSALLSLLVVSAVASGGCTASGTFACETDPACVLNGVDGTCEASGYCSFPDDTCSSGKRYGALAPAGIGSQCVPTQNELDDAGLADAPAPTSDAASDARPPADAPPAMPDATPPPDAPPPDAAVPFPDAGNGDLIVTLAVEADSWIDSENPTQNHGTDPALRADNNALRHAMIRFDLSGLPDDAIVQAAQVELHTTVSGGLPAGSVQLFRVLQGWTEGAGNGTDDAVNWTNRSTSAAWTNVGVGPPSSRDTVVVGEVAPATDNTLYIVPLAAAVVQAWALASTSNHGVIFVVAPSASGNGVYFVSSEGVVAKRPQLRVVYRLP